MKDFKKLYENIVQSEWFKKAYHNKSLGDCPFVIDELEESEDERIRKVLLNLVTNDKIAGYTGFYEERGITCDDAIAYLKKQKAQKPAEYLDKDKVYAIMKKLHDFSFSQRIPINSEEFKQIGEITKDVRELLDYPIEQKPAEWSDEDSRMLSDIVGYITGTGSSSGITKQERVDFLYGLSKRFNLQPKQEWSEENEETLEKLHRLLVICRGEMKFIQEADYNKMDNLLKSLRPSWKPSEEQMKALYCALNDAISLYSNKGSPLYEEISQTHFDALESLYNDLKKLI